VPNAFEQVKRNRRGYDGEAFAIRHYAERVIYDVTDWLDKNRDKLTGDQYACISSAESLKGERSLFGFFMEERDPDKKSSSSLGYVFRTSLRSLVDETLDNCHCNFVRCIKPNTLKEPRVWHAHLVLNQLQYTGMLDTLQIRKEGYPSRPTHKVFYEHYKPLFPDTVDHTDMVQRLRARGPQFSEKELIIGRTKVLIRDDTARALEAERTVMMTQWALVLQSVYRGCTYAKEYKTMCQAYRSAQPAVRQLISGTILSRAREERELLEEKLLMDQYLNEKAIEEGLEEEERQKRWLEEEYAWAISDATAVERFANDKALNRKDAKAAYNKGKELFASVSRSMARLETVGDDFDRNVQEEAMLSKGTVKPVSHSVLSRPYKYTFKVSKLHDKRNGSLFVVREC